MAYQQNDNGGQWDRWNSNASNSSYYNQPTHRPYGQGFMIASLVCGFLSVTMGCGLFIILGALGILFAMLTYRKGKRMARAARMGLILSVIGCVFQIAILYSSLSQLLSHPEQFENTYHQSFEEILGMDYDQYIQYLQDTLHYPVKE